MRRWRALLLGALAVAAGTAVAQDVDKLSPQPIKAESTAPAVPIAATPRALDKADVDTWLDGYMPFALNSSDIPGAVVVVVKDGKILTERGFGFADVEKRTPVDPQTTLFRPGSVSKLVTWTAVMQQVEQGKIDLDKDINTYLDFKIPLKDGKPVTMRELMTHTGGFEETAKAIIFYDPAHNMTLEQYIKRGTPKQIFTPGTTPAYSNWGTALAGYIVQRTSGEKFEDYIDRHILGPLGMRNSTFRQPLPANLKGHDASGYPEPGKTLGFEFIGPWPAGSMSASGADMGRFMIANLQGGELDGKRILSAQTAATMHNSPLGPVNPKSLIPPLNRMELGFFETNVNGREVIGHLGDTEGFHTSLHLFMKEGVGLYASFNSTGKHGAAGALRKALFMDFADRYFPNIAPRDGTVDAKTSAEHVRMMAGLWQNSRRWETHYFSIVNLLGQTKVEVGPKGELVIPSLVGPNGRPQEWVEIAPFIWRDRNGHDRVAAQIENGKVVRWGTDYLSPFMVFDRVPTSKSSAWILPAAGASLLVLLLTVIAWPVGWWNRRRYKAEFPLTGTAFKAYRATRITALAALAAVIGWGTAFYLALSAARFLEGALDPWLWILQIGGLVAFLAFVAATLWNLRLAFAQGRWNRKLWAVLMAAAALVLIYVAYTFGLIAMTVNY
jgi:CubicO group peptidase (beta-lactamase class C family)